jgi:S-adenosylmethionine:tRNA ribosyltransferase-isomerase
VDISELDYELPPERIAQRPAEPRDASRLMVVRPRRGQWEHRIFRDLPAFLRPGDALVRNVSRVVPARLVGEREATGGRWEGLFLRVVEAGVWEVLATTRGKPRIGEWVRVGQGLRLELIERREGGRWVVRPESAQPASELLDAHGQVPIPPYIRRGVAGPDDREHYQTVYARQPGSVAAPTAGLHFTSELIERIARLGVSIVDVTLHVGMGTFRPIEASRVEDHVMHAEWAELNPEAAQRLNAARADGGRIIAVGTTSVRTLEESARRGGGTIVAWSGETNLYIRPGHVFKGLDGMITNFHLPRSSLLALVAARVGLALLKAAYAEAIAQNYRFYSYGDAMLVLDDE